MKNTIIYFLLGFVNLSNETKTNLYGLPINTISTLEFKIIIYKIGVLSSLMWYIGLERFEIMTNSCYLFSNKLIMFLIVICSWFTAFITVTTPELWFTYWLLHQTNTSTTYFLIISTCIYLNSYVLLILCNILLLLIRLTTLVFIEGQRYYCAFLQIFKCISYWVPKLYSHYQSGPTLLKFQDSSATYNSSVIFHNIAFIAATNRHVLL